MAQGLLTNQSHLEGHRPGSKIGKEHLVQNEESVAEDSA